MGWLMRPANIWKATSMPTVKPSFCMTPPLMTKGHSEGTNMPSQYPDNTEARLYAFRLDGARVAQAGNGLAAVAQLPQHRFGVLAQSGPQPFRSTRCRR